VCRAQEYIKGIYDSGARVVVSNGSFGEMALHFIERCAPVKLKLNAFAKIESKSC
jgi:hypothetical protein